MNIVLEALDGNHDLFQKKERVFVEKELGWPNACKVLAGGNIQNLGGVIRKNGIQGDFEKTFGGGGGQILLQKRILKGKGGKKTQVRCRTTRLA